MVNNKNKKSDGPMSTNNTKPKTPIVPDNSAPDLKNETYTDTPPALEQDFEVAQLEQKDLSYAQQPPQQQPHNHQKNNNHNQNNRKRSSSRPSGNNNNNNNNNQHGRNFKNKKSNQNQNHQFDCVRKRHRLA